MAAIHEQNFISIFAELRHTRINTAEIQKCSYNFQALHFGFDKIMEQNFDEFTCATRADGGQGRHRKTYKTGLQASGKPTKTAP